ncbi:Rrf2 family transcriptional regulator [Granulicella sp. dw_53]|uniref:Rrf2 family transcriptional regulator n=1 Tax=Granulicella sp. dw_53 TaxID=2719792 RepID=UPI001BD37B57|nr:Rrf2 family transcriptional regulator [Granulicella sp. dw_53]
MQLTRFSDISLRLLIYLASRDRVTSVTVTARATSTLFHVPYTHMVKVVHQLGQHGLIVTTKGKGGGLRLSRPPESIRIGEVLRLTEPGNAVVDCFTQPCPLRFECLLKHALDDAYNAFFAHMDKFTLADIATMPALKTLVQLTTSL